MRQASIDTLAVVVFEEGLYPFLEDLLEFS